MRCLLYFQFSTLKGYIYFCPENLQSTINEISSNRESEYASNCEKFASTSKQTPVSAEKEPNFASKSRKNRIFRALGNCKGPLETPLIAVSRDFNLKIASARSVKSL